MASKTYQEAMDDAAVDAELGDASSFRPRSLQRAAHAIVCERDLSRKVWMAKRTAQAWHHRRLSLCDGRVAGPEMPDRPGRPPEPELRAPRDMPKRSTAGLKGRVALLHSLARIELSAVDMTWDLIGRFPVVAAPRSYFHDWVRVGVEEAKHFELLSRRLEALGSRYGALPAHDGLWQAAQGCGDDLLARMAIIPLVLEARGLDVGPPMIAKMTEHGDTDSARILEIIYRDEKRHVAFGLKWFRHFCRLNGHEPEPTFHALVRRHFRGRLRPPFNEKARSEAGLTPGFYKPLAAIGP